MRTLFVCHSGVAIGITTISFPGPILPAGAFLRRVVCDWCMDGTNTARVVPVLTSMDEFVSGVPLQGSPLLRRSNLTTSGMPACLVVTASQGQGRLVFGSGGIVPAGHRVLIGGVTSAATTFSMNIAVELLLRGARGGAQADDDEFAD